MLTRYLILASIVYPLKRIVYSISLSLIVQSSTKTHYAYLFTEIMPYTIVYTKLKNKAMKNVIFNLVIF